MKKFFVFRAAVVFFLFAPRLFAAFEDLDTGARAAALGGAYVALGDDTVSLMYNPAGLARLKQQEVTSEYTRYYTGLTDQSNLGQFFMGYGQPLPQGGTVAFGWKQFSLDNFYTERTLSLGYGRWLTSNWAAGAAIKQLHRSFGSPNEVVDDAGNIQAGTPALFAQNGYSQSAFSADLGVLYRLTERYTIGASIQDLNEPDLAVASSDEDRVPRTTRLGLAYQGRQGLSWTSALTARENLPSEWDYQGVGAVEKWWSSNLSGAWAVRGGLTLGTRSLQGVSSGFGYRFNHFEMDYAFLFNLSGIALGDTAGTHRFSLSYRFGPAEGKKEREKPVYALTASTAAVAPLNTGTTQQILEPLEVASSTPTPAVVPVAVAAPSRPPQSVRSQLELLLHLQEVLSHYLQLKKENAPIDERLVALEGIFDGLFGFYQTAKEDVAQGNLLKTFDPMPDGLHYFNVIRPFGASDGDRLFYIVRALEKYLEPYLRIRIWNQSDPQDARYQAWLGDIWDQDHLLVRQNEGAGERLKFIHALVGQAIRYERQRLEDSHEHATARPNY